MPPRPATTKKKPANSPKSSPAVAKSKPKPAATRAAKPAIYLAASELHVSASSAKPKVGEARGPYVEIAEARTAAMDLLLAAIEQAEARLLVVRRANSLEALRSALATKAS
jgi:hypothetical protein